MAQINAVSRNFIQNRLLDSTTGFNFWINDRASAYPGIDPFALTTYEPPNLFVGQFAPGDIDKSTDIDGTFAVIYSKRGDNSPGMVTPSEFSGTVMTVVDFFLSFPTDAPPADAESLGDLVQDAMLETFNRSDYFGLTVGTGLVYNNEMVTEFGPVATDGNNWRKLVRFTILMRLLTDGASA